ncbi:MAG: HAMP domain-containing histidine kinase [Deltaproteobacteria bacterium]|nr:HAMP domain-containing histidine kinase [Deltaproteobacteria bacterium]
MIFLISIAHGIFAVNISLLISALLVLLLIGSNIVFFLQLKRGDGRYFRLSSALMMFFDVGLLTILLMQISCALNPFIVLYIIYVFLGSLLLRPKCAFGLVVFTVVCYTDFFVFADPMVMDDAALRKLAEAGMMPPAEYMAAFTFYADNIEADLRSYILVLFTVFVVAIVIISFLVSRVRLSFEGQQKTIKELEKVKNRADKLATLATFAAGAAHEFATPLSTIAVASGEMLYHLREKGGSQDLIDDSRLIRDQVNRCKEILYQMSADAGAHLGENMETFKIRDLVGNILAYFHQGRQQNIIFSNQVEDLQFTMPMRTLMRTLRGVLKNAIEASEAGSPIFLSCTMNDTHVFFQVQDHGCGMDEQTRQRALDPIFTTKVPWKGRGLGLYLVQTMVERYGGDVVLESEEGIGTTVTMSFARNMVHSVLPAN